MRGIGRGVPVVVGVGVGIGVGIRVPPREAKCSEIKSKEETIVMMKEETVIANKIAVPEPVKVVMPKSEVMTMVEMSKCMIKSATARKMRCHPHAAVSSSHASSHPMHSRCLDRGLQE